MFGRWLTGGVAVGVFVVGSLCVGCSAKEPQGRITTVTVTAEPQAPEAEPAPDDPRPWASAVAGAAGPIRDAVFAWEAGGCDWLDFSPEPCVSSLAALSIATVDGLTALDAVGAPPSSLAPLVESTRSALQEALDLSTDYFFACNDSGDCSGVGTDFLTLQSLTGALDSWEPYGVSS